MADYGGTDPYRALPSAANRDRLQEGRGGLGTDPTSGALSAANRDRLRREWPRGAAMREIARIAGTQDGVVSRRDMLAIGVSGDIIDRHISAGDLRPVYRSVFSVGHTAISELGRWRAALLLAGRGACLSHTSAAQLLRLLDDERFAPQGMIHVTRGFGGSSGVRPSAGRRQPPARIHRSRTIGLGDVINWRGLPITSIDRTLIDLAGLLSPRRLEGAVLKAQRLNLLDVPRLGRKLSDRMRGRNGVGALRELIGVATPAKAKTLSDPEAWILDLLDRSGVPKPAVNETVEGFMVDFCWREARLVVEFDGHAFHSTREALRRDKSRDRSLQLAGYTVLRFTYEDLTQTPNRVISEITAALRSPRGRPRPAN